DAQAVSVSASLSGGTGVSLSIGLSLAHNTIANEISAYIKDAASVTTAGNILVKATDASAISASSVAAAVSAGISGSTGLALSGGASESTNVILTRTNAYIQGSALGTSATKVGAVELDATSN